MELSFSRPQLARTISKRGTLGLPSEGLPTTSSVHTKTVVQWFLSFKFASKLFWIYGATLFLEQRKKKINETIFKTYGGICSAERREV